MRWKRYTILSLACMLIVMGLSIGYCKKQTQSETKKVLKPEALLTTSISETQKEHLFKFALSMLENQSRGKLALIDPRLINVEEDGHNRYFLKIEGIGINNKQIIDLYHFYFILYESNENVLYIMPSGSQVLVGEVERVKEDILISMLKLINDWGIKD